MEADATLRSRVLLIGQAALIALAVATITYGTMIANFRSPLNALWMLALPALTGALLNNGLRRKVWVTLMLIMVSLVTTGATGVYVGYP